jgi:hypothetical protein
MVSEFSEEAAILHANVFLSRSEFLFEFFVYIGRPEGVIAVELDVEKLCKRVFLVDTSWIVGLSKLIDVEVGVFFVVIVHLWITLSKTYNYCKNSCLQGILLTLQT